MRLVSISILALMLWTSSALADRWRGGHRNDRRGDHRRPVVRDHRNHRPARPAVRDHRWRRGRYTGPRRANRRAIVRRPLHVNNGRFRFHNGRYVVYRRPVITRRYFNVRLRPQLIVEDYPPQYGYVWVRGNWSWNGREWIWSSGYYAPDPSIKVYYDDDSWDVDESY